MINWSKLISGLLRLGRARKHVSLYDENAQVLRNLGYSEAGPAEPREIDFAHVFQNETSAKSFASALAEAGFKSNVVAPEKLGDRWDVYASKVITPSCDVITATEVELGEMAERFGGKPDGWGFFRD